MRRAAASPTDIAIQTVVAAIRANRADAGVGIVDVSTGEIQLSPASITADHPTLAEEGFGISSNMSANTLSRENVVLEEILGSLARDTHGALSILGSTSLQKLGGRDVARQRVSERFDIWHSYVVVARQMLTKPDGLEAKDALLRVMDTIKAIRDGLIALVTIDELPFAAVAELRDRFPNIYHELQSELRNLGTHSRTRPYVSRPV